MRLYGYTANGSLQLTTPEYLRGATGSGALSDVVETAPRNREPRSGDRCLARISHQLSSRGREGVVRCGVCDPRGAERVLAVRRAPRGEQMPQIAADFRPQQKAGEKCGLARGVSPGSTRQKERKPPEGATEYALGVNRWCRCEISVAAPRLFIFVLPQSWGSRPRL
jgi:hypothetical protein